MNGDSSKPPHILYLIDEIKVSGGTEKHLFELATGMANAGFRVTVFSLADGEYANEFKASSQVDYLCLNVKRIYGFRGLSAILSIARYIRQQKVDILQSFHTASDLVGPVAANLSLRDVKTISSRRDLGYTKSPRHVKMQRYINHFVDGIFANSTAVKNSVIAKELCSEGKISIIHNGINLDNFVIDMSSRQQQRSAYNIDDQAILIGSVGNIRPVKGYDLLVEAAAIVCKNDLAVQFFHVGEGEMKGQLEARCMELGIEDRFHFLGVTKEIPRFLSALDIYVQPSRSEGMSNAILEAMAARLPVVATDVGGNPDLVEHGITGLLALGEDSVALAEQLILLVKQPLMRSTLANSAYSQVQEKFHISCMLRNYKTKYVEMTKNDCIPKTCY